MKKFLAILMMLIVAGGCFVFFECRKIMAVSGMVEFTQTVLKGDPAAADGLNVTLTAEMNNGGLDSFVMPYIIERYFWTSELNFREGSVATSSSLEFKIGKEGFIMDEKLSAYEQYIVPDEVSSALFEKYADEISKGEKITKDLWLGTLTDRLPLKIYITEKHLNTEQGSYVSISQAELVDEYFRFPVPDKSCVRLCVMQAGSALVEYVPSGYRYRCGSIRYKNSLYFYVNIIEIEGGINTSLVSYEGVPGGYGLYKIDLSDKEGILEADAGTLATVLPFSPGTVIVGLTGSENGDIVNVFVTEKGVYKVYSVDAKSCMLLGEEEICLLSDGQLDYVEDKDGFVLFAQGHAFAGNRQRIYCLEEDDKGVLKKALTADLDSMTDSNEVKSMFLDSSVYRDTYLHPAAYKNGKLYLVGNCFTYYDRPDGTAGPSISTSTGISLAVFDESGLLYFGTYRSSLGSGRVFNSYYHPPVLWFDDDQ